MEHEQIKPEKPSSGRLTKIGHVASRWLKLEGCHESVPKSEDEIALDKALDELGFEPETRWDRLRYGVGVRPERSRGGGIVVEPVKGASPSPHVVAAIRKMRSQFDSPSHK